MAEKEIKSRIVLDGEKEYSSTIKSASRNLKTLKSELQAETKELGNNATAQQKAEVKAKSLKAQIAEQEKVVKACRAALDEVKEKYGDNEDAVAKYEQKLNNARSALADMNNQLQDVSGSLEQNATESFANALEKVSSVGETVSSAIEGIFTGMVSTVQSAVTELWAMITATAARADDWSDLASIWGTDVQTIQTYSRAVKSMNDSFEDLSNAVTKITMGDSKKITELLGVSDVNYSDKWAYAMAVMDSLYKKAEEGEDITPIMEQIFGEKKSVSVMDLIGDWSEIQGLLDQFNGDESGYGMTTEGMSTMQQVMLNLTKIEQRWEALKDRIADGFGTTTLTLQAHVIGGLDALADFMNAESDEERQAALEKLTEEVEGFAQDVAAAIEAAVATLSQIGSSLKDSDNPYVSGVGSIFQAIADTMEWIIKNQDDVVNALKAIFGFWLVTKIASIAGKLSSIVASIGVIKAWSATNAATSAVTAEGAKTIWGNLGTTFTNLGGKIGTALGGFSTFSLNNLGVVVDWFSNDTRIGRALTRGDESVGEALTGTVEELAENVGKNASTFTDDWARLGIKVKEALTGEEVGSGGSTAFEIPENTTNPLNGITLEQMQAAETFWDYWKGLNGDEVSDEAWDAFESAFAGNDGLFDQLNDMMDRLYQTNDNPSEIGDLPASFWENLTSSETLKKSDVAAFNKVPEDMATAVEGAVLSGMSGIKVEMDGQVVGTLIAPYVNQQLALSMFR